MNTVVIKRFAAGKLFEGEKCEIVLPQSSLHQYQSCPHEQAGAYRTPEGNRCIFHLPGAISNETDKVQQYQLERLSGYVNSVVSKWDFSSQDTGPSIDLRRANIKSVQMPSPHHGKITDVPGIDLTAASVYGDVNLDKRRLRGPLILAYAQVRGWVSAIAMRAPAGIQVELTGSTFARGINFRSAQLLSGPNFRDCRFLWRVELQSAHIVDADFSHSRFYGPVLIGTNNDQSTDITEFVGVTLFENTKFRIDPVSRTPHALDMCSVRLFGETYFNRAQFDVPVSLDFAEFHDRVEFRETVFADAPSLVGTKFNEDVTFDGTHMRSGDEATFRKLKQLMSEKGNAWESSYFFARELEVRQARRNPFWRRDPLVFSYWLFAGYGRFWWVPLVWLLFLTFLVFPAIYAQGPAFTLPIESEVTGWEREVVGSSRYWQSLVFSLQNLRFAWLAGHRFMLAANGFAWVISVIQSVSGVLLLALIVILIRKRFRV